MPYFDHNATTPMAPAAREAWLHAQDDAWQNPSGLYGAGARVKVRLDAAREQLASLLGCAAERVVFTSGATEGANAVCAHLARTLPPGTLVAVNRTEHPCVLEAAKFFLGERVVSLEVDCHGVVSVGPLEKLLGAGSSTRSAGSTSPSTDSGPRACRDGSPQTSSGQAIGAVVVMAANNETGVLQPWRELARLCRRHHAAFFCDASQWLGKLPAADLGEADWAIGSAHKFGGPKGVGFVLAAEGAQDFHAQHGGGQERGHRAGTENFPGVAAMVAALSEAETKKVLLETERLRWRETFERTLPAALPGVRVVGGRAERLWNTVSLILPHGENTRWVARLDRQGFQVSTGSACATAKEGSSHVLAAMGCLPEEARRVIRASAGWETAETDWPKLAQALAEVSAEVKPTEAVISP